MAQVQLIIDAYVRYLLNRKSQTNLQMLTLRQLVDSSMSSIDIEKDNRIELLNGAYDLSNKKIQNDLRCFYKNCRMFVLFVSLLFFFILFYFLISFCLNVFFSFLDNISFFEREMNRISKFLSPISKNKLKVSYKIRPSFHFNPKDLYFKLVQY